MTAPHPCAILRPGRLTWAVAAVHGDAVRLRKLHHQLRWHLRPGNYLVYLGNFLGHGPAVGATINELLAFRRFFLSQPGVEPEDIMFLRGGQEEMWERLTDLHRAPDARQVLEWMARHGAASTLAAYGLSVEDGLARADAGPAELARWTGRLREAIVERDGHLALMRSLVPCAMTEHESLLFVAAGLTPHRHLGEQDDAFWWGSRGFDALDGFYRGGIRAVRGHDPRHRGTREEEGWVTIDGNCGFGGTLMAACFDPAGNKVLGLEA